MVFDHSRPSFRYRLADENIAILARMGKTGKGYKSSREKNRDENFHDEYLLQLRQAERFFSTCGCIVAYAPRFEADDVLAGLSSRTASDCVIYSNDKDMLQLASKRVRIYRAKDGYVDNRAPSYLVRRAMEGDASDDICGVPGIGSGRAEELVQATNFPEDPETFLSRLGSLCEGQKAPNATLKRAQHVLDCQELFTNSYRMMDLSETQEEAADAVQVVSEAFDKKAFTAHCRQYEYFSILAEGRVIEKVFTECCLWKT